MKCGTFTSPNRLQARNSARQDAITSIFRMIDEGRVDVEQPDVSVLTEVVDDLTTFYATHGITREEHRRMVVEVWGKMKAWLEGED